MAGIFGQQFDSDQSALWVGAGANEVDGGFAFFVGGFRHVEGDAVVQRKVCQLSGFEKKLEIELIDIHNFKHGLNAVDGFPGFNEPADDYAIDG